MLNLFRGLVTAAALAAAPAVVYAASADEVEDYQKVYTALVNQRAEAIVGVKYVMRFTTGGKEQRREDRTQGVLVSEDGLLLVPDRAVSFDFGALSGGEANGQMVANSSEFRVRMPGSDYWTAADLVTRDSELGVAWLRVRDSKTTPFVDLSKAIDGTPGMVFFTLLRTSDEWGAVPLVRPGMILGQTRTPRFALLADGMPGLAFDGEGRPMGFVDIDLTAIARSRGGGTGLDMSDSVMHMLPAKRIATATEQAAKMKAQVK